jgi:uncharacterized protein
MSGNKRYAKYFENEKGYLTVLNMMEIYYAVLREYGESAADRAFSANAGSLVEFGDDDLKAGMMKRLELRKKKIDLSYSDAVGYTVANRLRVRFLTGDRAFENLENVEYVK